MKKMLFFLLLSAFAFGQKFDLTSSGFVNADDKSKNFVVLEFPGKTQAELYKNVMILLNKKYKSAKNVISSVEPETITIDAIAANPVRRTGMHSFNNRYNITLSFRDDKVKIDAPTFQLTTDAFGKRQEMFLVGGFSMDGSSFGIFNKKGEVKIEKAVEDLNQFANDFVNSIKESDKKEDW